MHNFNYVVSIILLCSSLLFCLVVSTDDCLAVLPHTPAPASHEDRSDWVWMFHSHRGHSRSGTFLQPYPGERQVEGRNREVRDGGGWGSWEYKHDSREDGENFSFQLPHCNYTHDYKLMTCTVIQLSDFFLFFSTICNTMYPLCIIFIVFQCASQKRGIVI